LYKLQEPNYKNWDVHNTETSHKQGASKIVKISKHVVKLCQKLKCYFWDTVYVIFGLS